MLIKGTGPEVKKGRSHSLSSMGSLALCVLPPAQAGAGLVPKSGCSAAQAKQGVLGSKQSTCGNGAFCALSMQAHTCSSMAAWPALPCSLTGLFSRFLASPEPLSNGLHSLHPKSPTWVMLPQAFAVAVVCKAVYFATCTLRVPFHVIQR